jgi:hypothetical protein
VSTWHPILGADEIEPGVWHMPDPLGRAYAVVQLVEVHGERGYRVVTYAPTSADRTLIGYFRSLSAATVGANQWFVTSRTPRDRPNPGWL